MLAVNYGGPSDYTEVQVATLLGKTTFSGGTVFAFDTTNAAGPTSYDNAIASVVGITKLGPGTLTLSGANTYTGPTTINAGTLQSANNGALATTASMAVNNAGSTLAVNYGGAADYTQPQVATLLGKTSFAAGTTFGFDTTNALGPATYANAISIAGGITKLGPGTLTLSGPNTYTDPTAISAGTLESANSACARHDRIGGCEQPRLDAGRQLRRHSPITRNRRSPRCWAKRRLARARRSVSIPPMPPGP